MTDGDGREVSYRVLVVEDDPDVLGFTARVLADEGHDVDEAEDALAAMACIGANAPDLVVLDIELPHMNGLDLLGRIRQTLDVPIIFVTGRSSEADRVEGLRGGADDYVVKPFYAGELAARVDRLLQRKTREARRDAGVAGDVLCFGDLEIDPGSREVRLGEASVGLTTKEFDLLHFLASSSRQVFSREQLLRQVWNSSADWQDDATVTEHIRRIRRKIEPNPDRPQRLVTVRGVGYRFEP